MGIYVITGGATGIGAQVRKMLVEEGHEVFNLDFKGGDYLADLSKPEGRKGAIEAVFEKYPDGIDGLICNAGVGPVFPPTVIFSLNFFASTQMAEGLRPLLKKKGGCCVVTSSNSITNHTVREDWVDMLTNVNDEERVLEIAKEIPDNLRPHAYSSSKHALARWVRRVSPSWATDGLRINAVAPGNTTTPMTKGMTEAQMMQRRLPMVLYFLHQKKQVELMEPFYLLMVGLMHCFVQKDFKEVSYEGIRTVCGLYETWG